MTVPRPLTFPQSCILKTPAEFDRCYKRKRSASDNVLIVYACENGLDHPRLGCSVSKKIGNAVVRNRFKRLFREAFRLSQHEMPVGVDFIMIPRPGQEPTQEMVTESLVKLGGPGGAGVGDKQPNPQPRSLRGKGEPDTSPSPRGGGG
ncbi:MAG: ribonuclease P protein component [Gemmataceae bacterium]